MKKGIWEKIFRDVLFEGGKVPSPEERKKMYDKCYRKCQRKFKKDFERNPTKKELSEDLEDCVRDELYCYQLQPEKPRKNIGTDFETGLRNKQSEDEDLRRLGRINRDFWNSDNEENREESKKRENKKLKAEIEDKIRSESGYYA